MFTHATGNTSLLPRLHKCRVYRSSQCVAKWLFKLFRNSLVGPGLILLAHSVLLASHALGADYYRWTDQNGVLHLSEIPPQASMYTDIERVEKLTTKTYNPSSSLSTSTPNDQSQQAQALKDQELKENLDEQLTTPELEISLKDPKRCHAEKGRLAILNSGARIRMKGKNGEDIYLSAQQIQSERIQAQKAINESC